MISDRYNPLPQLNVCTKGCFVLGSRESSDFEMSEDGRQILRGIFSASQIARQLGVDMTTHEVARTFAKIEAVFAGA